MYEKPENPGVNHNNGHPLKPTLSASNKSAKLPSAPRIAGSTTASASPNLRKGTQHENTLTPKETQKEDIATPVKAFLSSNITPRSSSRKSRVGTTTPVSTPNGTPTNPRPLSAAGSSQAASHEYDGRVGLGINSANGGRPRRPRSIVCENAGHTLSPLSRSPEATSPRSGPQGGVSAGFENTPKFFHASEAKSFASPQVASQRPPSPTKSSSFVYANGADHESSSSARSSVGLPAAQEARIQAKFFPATSAPDKDTQPSPKSFNPTKPTLATIPSSQEVPSAQALTSHQHSLLQHEHTSIPRRSSTISRSSSLNKKTTPTVSPTSRRLSTSSLGQPRNQAAGTPQRQSSLKEPSSRRSSLDLTPPSRRLGHAKSASVGSLDTLNPAITNPRLRAADSPSPLTLFNVAALERMPKDDLDPSSPSVTYSVPQSPTKSTSTQQNPQQLNELAANARRERKVLDLEISNSSLLAINKTLERELNKQSAELRRFRRLSRSGRLSIATSTGGTVGELSALAESDDGAELSDMAEEDNDHDFQTLPNDGIKPTMDDGPTNSSNPVSANPSHNYHAGDEQPLRLDLSKHQALLVNSQKMNQSIKRCLGWTEELIKEGKKALEYRVQVEDIEHLEGRVLPPGEKLQADEGSSNEDDDHDDAGAMDKDDDILGTVGPLTSESELASMSWDFQSPRDSMSSEKDSGVELEPGEHPIREGFAKARDLVFRHLRETL
ncbi:MAG: hypothetical protein M1835_003380 [Candelina submexicana]|nr:MAG: hypothetical protein M1835_003380 [Candelina submexicana]